MNDELKLAQIPSDLLAPEHHDLPQASAVSPQTQVVIMRLPDGRRASITLVKTRSAHRRTTRWFWSPERAEILSE